MPNVCIIGKGSIGQRHAKIFYKLGYNIIFLRSTEKKIKKNIKIKHKEIYSYKDLKKININLFLICNPTSCHIESIKKIIKNKINILIEKPLVSSSKDLKLLERLYKKYKINLFLGYMLRFDPRIELIKSKIKNRFNSIRYANFIFQTYMPDWHPWEKYTRSYASNKKLGGGVLLTCSHEIDLATFLFGPASEVLCTRTKSFLKTNVENSVSLIIKHKNNITSNIILDFSSRGVNKRNFEIIFDKHSLIWNFSKPNVLIKASKKNSYLKPKRDTSIDKIYFYQANDIHKRLTKSASRKAFNKLCLAEKIIFAAKKSLKSKKFVRV